MYKERRTGRRSWVEMVFDCIMDYCFLTPVRSRPQSFMMDTVELDRRAS